MFWHSSHVYTLNTKINVVRMLAGNHSVLPVSPQLLLLLNLSEVGNVPYQTMKNAISFKIDSKTDYNLQSTGY